MTSILKRSEKKHSWSFGFKTKKKDIKSTHQTSAASVSLSREFFTELIKLEGDFFNGSYTLQTLNELTQYYAKAVEYYDHIKDDISTYFIYKIQDILATQKSLVMLSQTSKPDENNPSENKMQTPEKSNPHSVEDFLLSRQKKQTNSHIAEEDSEEEVDANEIERKKHMQRQHNAPQASISQMRNQKQRFVHFFYKMENEMENEKQTMKVVLDDYKDSRQKNDSSIQYNLNIQKQRLREKLEQRKYKSFASQTLNTNSFASLRNPVTDIFIRKERNGSTLESVLKALDDGDELDYRKFMSKPESIYGEFTPANLSICEDNEPKNVQSIINEKILEMREPEENFDALHFERNEALREKLSEIKATDDPLIKVKRIEEGCSGNFNSDNEKGSTEKDTSSEKEDSLGEKIQQADV